MADEPEFILEVVVTGFGPDNTPSAGYEVGNNKRGAKVSSGMVGLGVYDDVKSDIENIDVTQYEIPEKGSNTIGELRVFGNGTYELDLE